jgi:signal transduction histidine kinase
LAVLDAKVQETLTEVRRVCLDLRPSMIDDLGILPTLSWLLREVEEAGGLEVSKVVTVEETDVPEKLKITIFRVVQEAMCNIAKHAEASRVRVIFLRTEDSLRLVVEDNGRGFDPAVVAERASAGRGLGVRGMTERVRLSGGDYRLESAPGKGARIQMSWPVEDRADDEAANCSRAA